MTIKEALQVGFNSVESTTTSKYQPGNIGKIVLITINRIGVDFGDGFVIYYFKRKPKEKKIPRRRYIEELKKIESDGNSV